ncbi:MAG: sulfurtransferase [Legionellales bacterium]|nr:sulfurtransferase [Legionellales bacterium]|tara:strand:- start:78992 stop:79813 length:822 start_codon:yes stop_codon:yes gene_type:complete
MNDIVNISGYKFAELDNLQDYQRLFKDKCKALGLMGTVLLTPEGSNHLLAGSREATDAYRAFLETDPNFAGIVFKQSYSDRIPFRRLRVRVKKEAITTGRPEVNPGKFTGPHISAATLKQWYDEGKDMFILDTRNDYEIKFGTFDGAVDLDIQEFSAFDEAIDKLDPAIKDKPVVMFCTGGIRCEKASPIMMEKGFKEVYQLDGGILKYFEECGGEHYHGDCYVFDGRVALKTDLSVSNYGQCQKCQNPIELTEGQIPHYMKAEHCGHCAAVQ